jgi:hypothetical protein
MLQIKINHKFIDLGQRKFTISLRSPLYFDSSSDNSIPSSLLLSVKAPLSPRNVQHLGNPHLLTNPNNFLKGEYAEIWAEGSPIFTGIANVTEARDTDFSLSIAINSAAGLKDFNLSEAQYGTYSGSNGYQECLNSVLFPDNYAFNCPTVWAPNQWGDEVTHFDKGAYQNLYRQNDFISSDGATIAPFLKITKILRGCFEKLGYQFSNVFESDAELKNLLLYYANPINNRAGAWRFQNFELKNHVPKMAASELTKHFARFYNLGLFIDGFDNVARLKRADSVIEAEEYVDWSKIVLKKYKIEETGYNFNKFSMPMPDALTNLYSTKWFPSDDNALDNDKRPEGIFKQSDGSLHYRKSYLPPQIERLQDGSNIIQSNLSVGNIRINANFDYPKSFDGEVGNAFEAKIQALPQAQCQIASQNNPYGNDPRIFELLGFFPVSYAKNHLAGAEQDKIQLMLYRGLNETGPVATSEHQNMYYDTIGVDPYPYGLFNNTAVKLGNKPPSGPDNRQSAQHSIQFGGVNGVFKKHWEKWANFLKAKREVEFDLLPKVQHLRQFAMDKRIIIGNQHYLCKQLDIELSEKGIEGAKGQFLQL